MMAVIRTLVTVLATAPSAFAAPTLELLDQDNVVPGRYIVTLKPGVQMERHLNWATRIHLQSPKRDAADTGVSHRYAIQDFSAYAGAFDEITIDQIRSNDDVALVEPSTMWGLFQTPSQPALTTQNNVPWGLSSISHKASPNTDYIYDPRGGTSTYAYIVDTGLATDLPEFEGRADFAFNAVNGSTNEDNVGHGTHVAGTIGSKSYGVAKAATLVSVKVLDSELGLDSEVMAGYNWAVQNITAEGREASSVISMSLGGRYLQAFNDMVEAAYQAGITTVVAAGNYGELANATSPASAPNAITVGAMAANFSRPAWSDYGTLVDIFAPGVDVLSTWPTGNLSQVLSGTSMSAPHVSGLVLYLKSIMSGLDSPSAVASKVQDLATKGLVQSPGDGSPNAIAYNGNGA